MFLASLPMRHHVRQQFPTHSHLHCLVIIFSVTSFVTYILNHSLKICRSSSITSLRKMVKYRFGIIMLLRSLGLFACPCLFHHSKGSDHESIDGHQPESSQLNLSHPLNITQPFPSPPILHQQTASTAYHLART